MPISPVESLTLVSLLTGCNTILVKDIGLQLFNPRERGRLRERGVLDSEREVLRKGEREVVREREREREVLRERERDYINMTPTMSCP